MALLLSDIAELVTNDPSVDGSQFGVRTDAAVLIEGSTVLWHGPNRAAARAAAEAGVTISDQLSLVGQSVIPGFVDSHTHLIFAGDRVDEFEARMRGERYTAGGISQTVGATRAASDDELRTVLRARVQEANRQGTTTIEIKSGYGLDLSTEARMVRLAREVTEEVSFLGAHLVPTEYADRRAEYLQLVCGPMLEAVLDHARWIDVFCEDGAFTPAETRQILEAGRDKGLGLRLHAGQLAPGPGVRLAVELGAAAVDHCTFLEPADVIALAESDTVATLLPGAEFSTRQPYPNARELWDAGVTIALASDCNPGSSYTTSMPFMIALAVREMGLSPAEALWAATAGGARALLRNDIGGLLPGMRADLVVLDAPSARYLAYRPGVPLVARTMRRGVWLV